MAVRPGPTALGLVVDLGNGGFDSVKSLVAGQLGVVVVGVGFKKCLKLLGRCGRSLFEQGLLNELVPAVVQGGVDDTPD